MPPSEDTRPPLRQNDPLAGKVIVPKLQSGEIGVPKARLTYKSVEGLETEFVLDDHNSIGRHPKNSIRLHDREVSKEHATIIRTGDDFVVKDLDSSNGTFVNNKRIKEVTLREGDELLFGALEGGGHVVIDCRAGKILFDCKPLVLVVSPS